MKPHISAWLLAAAATLAGGGVAVANPAYPNLAYPSPDAATPAFAIPPWRQEGAAATNALNMLEAQGYGQFSHFRARGMNFTADVRKDGLTMRVTIDPRTDQIYPDESANI
jgi:hypothetical protein